MAEHTAFTNEINNEAIAQELMKFATSDEYCCYHGPIANSGKRKIKITLLVEDAD